MKKTIYLLSALVTSVMLEGCRAHMPVSQQSGKDDTASLLFISSSNRGSHDVNVTLDGSQSFVAKTVKSKKANRRGTQYTVKTGNRSIKVTDQGKTVYEKNIFLSAGQTKEIILP